MRWWVSLVEKLDFLVDLTQLKSNIDSLVKEPGFNPKDHQLCLMHSLNCNMLWHDGTGSLSTKYHNGIRLDERSYNIINDSLKGTYLFSMLTDLQKRYNAYRARIMKLRARSCYSWHKDNSKRIHIAINTNEHCRIAFESGTWHIPADGYAYSADTTLLHTAFNGSQEDRLHLVCCINI